jgi:NitT/TauT family transport system substrate-binding protein
VLAGGLALLVLVLGAGLTLGAAGAGCARPPPPPLAVGTVPWPGSEPFYLARTLGALRADQVRLVEYVSTTQMVRAFRNGAVDAAVVSLDEVLMARHLGQDAQVVLVVDTSAGADCVVARRGVEGVAGLRGRRVATEDLSLSHQVLTRALQSAGLSLADVKKVPATLDAHEELFHRGEVDGVVTFEPNCSRLAASGGRVVFDSRAIPGEIADVLMVRREALTRHPERVDALVRAYFAAVAHVRKDPADAHAKMCERLGLTPEQFAVAFGGMELLGPEAQGALLEGPRPGLQGVLAGLQQLMLEGHFLPAPVDVTQLLAPGPQRRARP